MTLRGDVLADEFSSAITTLEDELMTLRSQRDVLIDAANSTYSTVWDSFPMDETVVDWYVMEQFRKPWKFRESFLEKHKCLLITALLFAIKQIFNILAKIIIKLVEGAAGATGIGATLVVATTAKYAFCLGWFHVPPLPGPFAIYSLILDGHKKFFQAMWRYFREKACGVRPSGDIDISCPQGPPFWNTLAGE